MPAGVARRQVSPRARPASPVLAAYEPTLESPWVSEKKGVRLERDSMGEMEVPADAYYGASTQRAVLNFPISGQSFPRRFIRALGLIKKPAAQPNSDPALLSNRRPPPLARAPQPT